MNKTSTVRAGIALNLKDKAEKVFNKLGLTSTQAITLFYEQGEMKNGLPFDLLTLNETTQKTFNKTDSGKDLVICKDVDDMFSKLGI